MFPIRDSHHTNITPIVTYGIILLNAFFFFLEMTAPDLEAFIRNYALIPAQVNFSDTSTLLPFISSQFLHAGYLHIISNMWFLKIFGDNVEEVWGAFKYLIIYLLSGVAGGLLQYFFSPDSQIPMLGASGAVAGVLGAYFVRFPNHKIETLVPFGFFMTSVNISASVMLVYWFITQLFSGVGSLASTELGGVAFWAHVGGFAFGYLAAKLLPAKTIKHYSSDL